MPPVQDTPAAGPSPRGYQFGEFTVDAGQRTLHRHGERISLPWRTFAVLLYLIENSERCVRKDEIIDAIWEEQIVTDDSLVHAISVLRRTLGDDRRQPEFIQTVPRKGYRFVAAVRPLAGPKTENAQATNEGAAAGDDTSRARSGTTVTAPDLTGADGRTGRARTPARWLIALATGAAAIAATAVLLNDRGERADPAPARVRLFQPPPADTNALSGGVLSPDGRYLAMVASNEAIGQAEIWIRTLRSNELERLRGTAGASKPFWSPDSQQLGYFAHGKLIVVNLASETRRTIAPVFAAAGGSWSSDNTILFAEWASGLYAVPATGDGDVRTIATLDREADDIAFAWPQFFPDDRHFIYQVVSLDGPRSGIYVGSLDSARSRKLLDTTSAATLAPPDRLLHVQGDMLIAEELDMERLELTGRAMVVSRGLSEISPVADNVVSASADLLAFKDGVARQRLSWHDRTGKQVGALAMPTVLFNPRISPDGSQLLGTGSVTTDPGLWLVKLDNEEYARLETEAIGPIWSRDSRHVALTSRDGFDLIVRALDDPDDRRLLASGGGVKILNDWSSDGAHIVYTQHSEATNLDLWIIDVRTEATRPLLATPHSETQARISPDGAWIAYASDESGVLETYVARFPSMDDRRQVSVKGGAEPQWRADQGELFYLSLDQSLMAVAVDAGEALDLGPPRQLFRVPLAGNPGSARDYFAVSADGQQFLIDGTVTENGGEAITVMVNWSAGMPERSQGATGLPRALP